MGKKKKGFTLVELLLAVFILTGAIGGALLLYVTSMVSLQLAWDSTVATSHAEHILEEAQLKDSFESIQTFDWTSWAQAQGMDVLPSESINVVLTNLAENPLDIEVTVAWIRKSRTHEMSLQTKIAR